jgi:hypothetical protein
MSAPGLQKQLAEARKAQLRRQKKEDADSLKGTPHQQAVEEIEDPIIGMTLSESDLLDLAALYSMVRSDDQIHLKNMPRDPAKRRAYIRSMRPEKLEHIFPEWWSITEGHKNTLLQGKDPFGDYNPITGDDVFYPETAEPRGFERGVGQLGVVPALLSNAIKKRRPQQQRSKEAMLSRIRGTPHEEGSGGAYNRGYWNKAEQIRNLPAEDLLVGLTTGQLYGEDFLGTGVAREIGDIHSSFVPGYWQVLTGGPDDAPRGTHTGNPLSTEEKLMPRGEKLTELSERLGGLELQQYLLERNQRNKSAFMRLQKRLERRQVTPEYAQKEGLRLLGMDPETTGVAAPTQQQQPQPPPPSLRAEEPNTQLQPDPQPALQTPSHPKRRSYKKNAMTGEYLYPIVSEQP